MGRITEIFDFLNRNHLPDPKTRSNLYHYIDIDDEMIKLRLMYRNDIDKQELQKSLDELRSRKKGNN